ncbi:carbon monoxide dehydrogenase [Nitratireductor sp. CAU 1489]|uniref:Carbon monoxide dehydrogenase n=1 Tax=Nitratireductor arenosus TaxID=2682096 RepID=A0A844QM33_9HYPH|nr:xanthine dehydrogenase family protein subunit M [Nitratireductor arenosus]MVA99010.1 carbon monoxide dehydrogenase [Nitratireductor arenosus]
MNKFDYVRPTTLAATLDLLRASDEPMLLAGGQTLLPTMKQGLAAPELLIDLNAVSELVELSVTGDGIRVGAMCRHATVATSGAVRDKIPGLAELAGMIGDVQVRNRGTIGGSVANNDPAADYPAALLALDATIRTDSRDISADEFFVDLFETALEPGEMIREVVFPSCRSCGYLKFRQPASRFAIVGVFVARHRQGVRVAVTGAGSAGVFRWTEAEAALDGNFAQQALTGLALDPQQMLSDIHAGDTYRAHLVQVLTGRLVEALGARSLRVRT